MPTQLLTTLAVMAGLSRASFSTSAFWLASVAGAGNATSLATVSLSDGAAFAGGLGMIGAADIVITVDEVPYSFSEVRIGVIPAIIAVVCMPKLGPHHATRLFVTGERFDGRRAVEMGFAHRAVPKDALAAAVQEEVDMIALGGPIAVVECKKLAKRVPQLSLDEGLAEMAVWSRRMFGTPEAAEGMAAFREKRKPAWVKGS